MAGELVEGDPFEGRPPLTTEPTARITVTPRRDEGGSSGGGSNLVEGDPFAATPGSMTKAYGIGVAQGAIGIPGMAGDVTEAGKGVANWLSDHVPPFPNTGFLDWMREETAKSNELRHPTGNEPPDGTAARGDVPGSFSLPTSKDIQGLIEKVTGKFYEPKNQAERDAVTAGQYTTGAALAPGGLLAKTAQAVIPAAADIIAGRYSDQNPYVKALAGFLSSVATGHFAAPGSADKILRSKIPASVTEQHINRAGQLIDYAQSKGVKLTWPEALSRVVGQPVLSDTQRILESHPRSRAVMDEFLADRPAAIKSAAKTEFDRLGASSINPSSLGPTLSEGANETIDKIRQTINAITRPSYDAAKTTLVSPAAHAQMINDPLFADALQSVRGNPAKSRLLQGQNDRSVAVYDAVKQELNERAQNAAKLTNPKASQTVAKSAGGLAGDVREAGIAADRNRYSGPGHYERALADQAALREKYLNPVLAGPLGKIADNPETKKVIEALFNSNPLPGSEREIGDAMRRLVASRPAAAEQLVRAHAEMVFNEAAQSLQGGANQFGGAKFAKLIAGNDQQRANLKAAIEALPNGADRWKGFEHLLDIMQATGTRQAKGSLTAFNALEVPQMTTGGLQKLTALGLSPGKWMTFANDTFNGWSNGRNLDTLARVLTDPRYGNALKQIVRLPAGSDRALVAAGRLMRSLATATTGPRLNGATN